MKPKIRLHTGILYRNPEALFFVILVSMIIFSSSCQKVINLDLNSTSPQLVVQGNITDGTDPGIVDLTRSVNFDAINQVPSVTGATVEITDSVTGTSEILREYNNGIYLAPLFRGIPGHRYILLIKADGESYRAISEMPQPVGFSKLEILKQHGDSPFDTGINYVVSFEINDPPEYENYYRIIVLHDGRLISSRRVFDDQFHNGKIIADEFDLRDSVTFNPGDTVRIDLMNIDKNTYNFFRTLRNAAGGLSFLSASPANPISNISNNGLGYFSASSVRSKTLTIPR